jgi:hypothetical protein
MFDSSLGVFASTESFKNDREYIFYQTETIMFRLLVSVLTR